MNNLGIIGVGRLGLAYALVFEQKGLNVWASSYKKEYIDALKQRKTDSVEPGIKELLSKSSIRFTVDNGEIIDNCDVIYVMVATPSTNEGSYDILAVHSVVQDLINHPHDVDGKILIVGCTVNPGDCQNIQKILSPRNVSVVYCPTFTAQGSVLRDIQNPHTLSIGCNDPKIAECCKKLFSLICPEDTPIYVIDPTTAEVLKLAGNCRATMEISFFNMIGQILLNLGLEKDLDLASQYLNFIKSTVRWKFGFGYGGPCYPRDNRSFAHFAKMIDMNYPLGKVVDDFNKNHVDFLTEYFLEKNKDAYPFYFEYVSYKKGVNIFEESHQLNVCTKLLKKGAKVYIEPTEFLPSSIQNSLTEQFGDCVKFIPLNELQNNNIKIYPIEL